MSLNTTLDAPIKFVRQLTSPVEIQAAQRLRHAVWQAEGAEIRPSFTPLFHDWHDDYALHWGAYDADELVRAARMCIHNEMDQVPDAEMFADCDFALPVATLGRLVVRISHRGMGLGRASDEVRITAAERMGAKTVTVAPVDSVARRGSLKKRGFRFLEGTVGTPIWSSNVQICACYLRLEPEERVDS
jgi:GNAT superfamily N-acetyltransferase